MNREEINFVINFIALALFIDEVVDITRKNRILGMDPDVTRTLTLHSIYWSFAAPVFGRNVLAAEGCPEEEPPTFATQNSLFTVQLKGCSLIRVTKCMLYQLNIYITFVLKSIYQHSLTADPAVGLTFVNSGHC